ncbi:unnamed protein product [Schistosoma margrebowiei]|uniref:Uncharacterized protein n=1 Tax=Schistosoma margrebowiei TaxID=48269 RepID=A0A183LES9_9TREM|nr:unnamed protein product [Schistosoma margrebowiei]
MPLTPVGSNMTGGLQKIVGTPAGLVGSTLPLTSMNKMMPSDMSRLATAIPASPAGLVGSTLPLTSMNKMMPSDMSRLATAVPAAQMLSTNMQIPKSPVITNMLTNASGSLPQNSMIPSTISQNNPSINSNIFNFENLK